MKKFLAVSILGSDQPGLIFRLTNLASSHNCNIEDSRMTTLGEEFAIIMLVSGSWDAIAKYENQLNSLTTKKDLVVHLKHTSLSTKQDNLLQYNVNILALDNLGLITQISEFFHHKNLNIVDLYTGTYPASYTSSTMFSLNMTVYIPSSIPISELREQFIVFCDDLNVDASIELEKN